MPARFQPEVDHDLAPTTDSLAFAFADARLAVIRQSDELVALPTFGQLGAASEPASIYLGRLDGQACFAVLLDDGTQPNGALELSGLRELFGHLDEPLHGVAGRAYQTLQWYQNHAFCGRCGTPTEHLAGERARGCPGCGMAFYPRINPAVIMLVEREGKILLAQNRQFRGPWYSCLAGFVEPGESLEEAVEREVLEEAGIGVKDVTYFASQPWPFPSQLMIGFNARYAAGEIDLQDSELVDAGWYGPDELPNLPGRFSLARRLIEGFLERHPERA